MKDNYLIWFEYVQRWGIDELVSKIKSLSFEDLNRGRERPNMT